MERFFHRLHVRRESLHRDVLSKRHNWEEDERRVRNAHCDFAVKYLGSIEVNETKGIHVIENTIRTLRFGEHGPPTRFTLSNSKSKLLKSLHQFGELQVSGFGLRFFNDSTEDVLVESPIGKISFCGPVDNGKYFGYICREEVHWKWICHTFKSTVDHADRINNAVGCAFHICVEEKHKARMEKKRKGSSTAPPTPQGPSGSLIVPPGPRATSARTTATLLSTVSEAPSCTIHEGPKSQVPPVDEFELAWHSKAQKDAQSQL